MDRIVKSKIPPHPLKWFRIAVSDLQRNLRILEKAIDPTDDYSRGEARGYADAVNSMILRLDIAEKELNPTHRTAYDLWVERNDHEE